MGVSKNNLLKKVTGIIIFVVLRHRTDNKTKTTHLTVLNNKKGKCGPVFYWYPLTSFEL